jgi:hypothetical protein
MTMGPLLSQLDEATIQRIQQLLERTEKTDVELHKREVTKAAVLAEAEAVQRRLATLLPKQRHGGPERGTSC